MKSFLRFPDGKYKALTFSYDDAVTDDRKLVKIFKNNGLKATFNLNGGMFGMHGRLSDRIPENEVKSLYVDNGFEVACHGYYHPRYLDISSNEIIKDIIDDRVKLEAIVGKPVTGMAYPFGTFDDRVVSCLKNCGIEYSRTVRSTHSFGLPENPLILDPTCHHNDPELDNLANSFLDISDNEERSITDGILFYVWGHAYEFRLNNNWNIIDDFASKISGKDDVWYATNIEIVDYLNAYRSLKFSFNGDFVFNPSATDVWLVRNKKSFVARTGKTTSLK